MVIKSGNNPIKSVGLSIQRSTFMFWDKKTKQPFSPAISSVSDTQMPLPTTLSECRSRWSPAQ